MFLHVTSVVNMSKKGAEVIAYDVLDFLGVVEGAKRAL